MGTNVATAVVTGNIIPFPRISPYQDELLHAVSRLEQPDDRAAMLRIPKNVLKDASLSPGNRLLLGFIAGHQRGCFRKTTTIADNLGITPRSIRRGITTLQSRGFLLKRKNRIYAEFEGADTKAIQAISLPANLVMMIRSEGVTARDKLVFGLIYWWLRSGAVMPRTATARALGCGRSDVYKSTKRLNLAGPETLQPWMELWNVFAVWEDEGECE